MYIYQLTLPLTHSHTSTSAVSHSSVRVCYLDLAGSLDVVDGVESLLHRLPQSHNAVIPQDQNLRVTKSTPDPKPHSVFLYFRAAWN